MKMKWINYQRTPFKKSTNIHTNLMWKNSFPINKNQNFSEYIKEDLHYPLNISLGQMFTLCASPREKCYKALVVKNSVFENKSRDLSFTPKTGMEWEMLSTSLLRDTIFLQISGKLITGPPTAIASQAYLGGGGTNNFSGEGNTGGDFNNNLSAPLQFPDDDSRVGIQALYIGKIMTTLGPLGDVNITLGQSCPLSTHRSLKEFQQINHYLSDYVSHVEISPFNWINLSYRGELNQKSLRATFYEIGATIESPIASLSGSYSTIQRPTNSRRSKNFKEESPCIFNNTAQTKKINFFLSSQITDSLSLTGTLMQGLQKKKREKNTFQYGIGTHYHTKFFTLSLTVNRQPYPGMTPKTEALFMVTFGFNNEGDHGPPLRRNAYHNHLIY